MQRKLAQLGRSALVTARFAPLGQLSDQAILRHAGQQFARAGDDIGAVESKASSCRSLGTEAVVKFGGQQHAMRSGYFTRFVRVGRKLGDSPYPNVDGSYDSNYHKSQYGW